MPTGPNLIGVIAEHGYLGLVNLIERGYSPNQLYRWIVSHYPELTTEEATFYAGGAYRAVNAAGALQMQLPTAADLAGRAPVDPEVPAGQYRYTVLVEGFDPVRDRIRRPTAEIDALQPIDIADLEQFLRTAVEQWATEYGFVFSGQAPVYQIVAVTRGA